MKRLLIFFSIVFLVWVGVAYKPVFVGTTYYVKAAGGTGSGLDDANAWSLAKFNTISLSIGDSVKFKCGDVFAGGMTNLFGGSVANPVTLSTYSTGANPKFSGFTTLSSWTLSSGNIYYATLSQAVLRMVLLDGNPVSMGRYPNTGYLYISSHSGNSSITDASVAAIPFDPTGAQAVIRKDRYVLDRQPVTSRSGSTLNYTSINPDAFGYTGSYSPLDSNGYFIQGSLGTLDQPGEWYFDVSASRFYMYFSGLPGTHTVKVATTDALFYLYSQSNIVFNNLDFEGGNSYGGFSSGATRATFNGCNFSNIGGDAFYGISDTLITFRKCTAKNTFNNGFYFEYQCSRITVDSCSLYNTGNVAGMGKSGDFAQESIHIEGDHSVVTNDSIRKAGYNGVGVNGDTSIVRMCFIDSVCQVKDDGAGIYTYLGLGALFENNVITNVPGDYNGAHWNPGNNFGLAACIYLDNGTNTHNATVRGNTGAGAGWSGIVLNNNAGNSITGNTFYDNMWQLFIADFNKNVRRSVIRSNKFIAKTASQLTFKIELGQDDTLSLMGLMDDNIYARPVDDDLTISIYRNYVPKSTVNISLHTWKTTYKQDRNSQKSAMTTASAVNFIFGYNVTGSPTTPALPAGNYIDVAGATYATTYPLSSFTSKVMLAYDPASRKKGTVVQDPTLSTTNKIKKTIVRNSAAAAAGSNKVILVSH